jgi:hypothetical protein
MWILYTIIIILVGVICTLIYALSNQSKKVDIYENWIDQFSTEVFEVYVKLRQVDEKNLFVKDDDVGFVFSEILRIIKEFNEKVGK